VWLCSCLDLYTRTVSLYILLCAEKDLGFKHEQLCDLKIQIVVDDIVLLNCASGILLSTIVLNMCFGFPLSFYAVLFFPCANEVR